MKPTVKRHIKKAPWKYPPIFVVYMWRLGNFPEFDQRKGNGEKQATDKNKKAYLVWQDLLKFKNINT